MKVQGPIREWFYYNTYHKAEFVSLSTHTEGQRLNHYLPLADRVQ